MVFRNLCVSVLWMKVGPALEGLIMYGIKVLQVVLSELPERLSPSQHLSLATKLFHYSRNNLAAPIAANRLTENTCVEG